MLELIVIQNPNILKMFGFVNIGERAGSGVDKIMTAWKEQNWKKLEFDFSECSDWTDCIYFGSC